MDRKWLKYLTAHKELKVIKKKKRINCSGQTNHESDDTFCVEISQSQMLHM
jgi:hypothetical protein